MKLIKSLLSIAAVTMIGQSAFAAQITGDIGFIGNATFDLPMASATRVTTFTGLAPGGLPQVSMADGDFAGLLGNGVTVQMPYVFNPPTPYNPLYSVGGFVFQLVNSHIMTQNANGLVIVGTGIFTNPGVFDATPGTWAFSSQNSKGDTRTTLTFSTDNTATPSVPDSGSTLSILGLGLVAVEILRRKLAAA